MKMNELTKIEWSLLAATLLVTIATSKSGDVAQIGNYGAATNCANATRNNISITTSGSSITIPSGISFLDFGMPLSTLNVTGTDVISAEISPGVVRSCAPSTTTNSGATMYLYSCKDNGVAACQVSFTTL